MVVHRAVRSNQRVEPRGVDERYLGDVDDHPVARELRELFREPRGGCGVDLASNEDHLCFARVDDGKFGGFAHACSRETGALAFGSSRLPMGTQRNSVWRADKDQSGYGLGWLLPRLGGVDLR